MKPYILITDEGDIVHTYAVFADTIEEAYEKIKTPGYLCMTDDENFVVHNDFVVSEEGAIFTCTKDRLYRCICTLIELKESDNIIFIGSNRTNNISDLRRKL